MPCDGLWCLLGPLMSNWRKHLSETELGQYDSSQLSDDSLSVQRLTTDQREKVANSS